MKTKIDYLAFALLLLPVSLLLVSGLTWSVGMSISVVTFPLGLILALLLAHLVTKRKEVQVHSMCLILIGLVVGGALCALIHDPAFDSNWYHQPGIYLLSHGWNPIWQHHSVTLTDSSANMWVDHYAKGQETICATIVALTGNIEVGKLGNFFLPLSSLLFAVMALRKMFPDWSSRKLWLLGYVVAFPPVIWNQLFSFYIDFNLYAIIMTSLCSAVLYREEKAKFLAMFVCLLAMAAAVKFNILMWFGMVYMGMMVWFWRMGRRDMVVRIIGYGVAGALVTVLTFSFNPYITNTIDHQTPVYPLMGGAKQVDIMTIVEPELFKEYNNLEKILVCDFSRPTSRSQCKAYFFPYGGYPLKNLTACGTDPLLGGAGLFWIDVLMLSILVFCITKCYRTRGGKWALGLSLAFLATQFLVPGGCFYRYVSYIYLIPIFLLLATEREPLGRKTGWLRRAAYALLLANSLVAMTASLGTTIASNQIEDYYIKCINASDKPCYSSNLYGFVSQIDEEKRKLGTVLPTASMEQMPLVLFRVRVYLDYKALNRDVPTTFVQDLLLKKGVLK